jgi:hypothetical protein
MMRFTLLILIIISLLAGSCTSRNKKLDSRNLIPEKEMVSILTEVYMVNGLLPLPKIHSGLISIDSVSTYHQIFLKRGYSKETMDKTMKYYFYRNPKELIKIYDEVLGKLSRMESLTDKEAKLLSSHIENRWPGKASYFFPDNSVNDSVAFDLPLERTGVYTLSFTATLFPDDESVNPRMTAFTCNRDSLETGKKRYFKTLGYIKDGRPHIYDLIVIVPAKKFLHLRGLLYDFDNNRAVCEKHAGFEDISMTFAPAAL